MKKYLRLLFLIVPLFGLLFVSGCNNTPASSSSSSVNTITSVTISGGTEVKVGSTITLTVTILPDEFKNSSVTWTSSDDSIATVANGVVTGVKEGQATITAKAGNVSDTHVVKVTKKAEGVTPNTEVKTQPDTRAEAYVLYSPTGVELERFKSLYAAIEYTVNNEDYGSYITKAEGADKNVKLFTFNDKFASDSDDMFYYYKNGNQLDTYTSWQATYWQTLKDLGDAITVSVSPSSGTGTYFASHALAGVSTTEAGADSTAYWNVSQKIEAAATVNMLAYSGITKATYEIDLKSARITPTYDNGTVVYAEIGFVIADAYNVSNMGLACDTSTGNWYYYSGETPWNGDDVNVDKSVTLMTSTWNAEGGYFVPNENIIMTAEILTLLDEDNAPYIVDRVTFNFVDSNRTVVRDYELSALTQCGTVRFTAALDIVQKVGLPDYMNGAKFENLVITKATAYALEEMQDSDKYGQVPLLDAGVYDILNSNPETAARYQTIIYNPAVVKYDFSTAGKDVYNFSYNFDSANRAYSTNITDALDKINAIPAVNDLVAEDEATYVIPAREAYNRLSVYQNKFIDNLAKLEAAEAKCLTFHFNEVITEVVSLSKDIKELSAYTHLDYIKGSSTTIISAYNKFMALNDAEKAVVLAEIKSNKITEVYDFYMAIKDLSNWNVLETINWAMSTSDYSFDNTNNLNTFKNYYQALTSEDLATIPQYIINILNAPDSINSYIKQIGYYDSTLEIILKWMDTYNIDLDVKDGQGLVDTSAILADAANIDEDLNKILGMWIPGVMNETWNFRNNFAGRFDFVTPGGYAKYYPVLYSVVYYTDGISYNWDTGFFNSDLVNATKAAKEIASKYVNDTTYAGICDMDNDVAMKALKAAYEGLTENQKNGLVGNLREIADWALAKYNYQYDTMAELATKIEALDKEAATFAADLKVIVDEFNTVLPSTSYFFRNSTSPWAPAGFPNYVDVWTKLSTSMTDLYSVDPNTGYIVPVV
jgi:hypothetical protein